jgi:hypothetical protein
MKRLVFGLGVALIASSSAQAERLVGLTNDNRIVSFDSSTPGAILTSATIVGLGSDSLLGIDVRATDRAIYGLGQSGSVYRLSRGSGSFTANNLGTITTSLNGSNFDIDWNPAANRLRVASNANQSLRLNPDVGGGTVGTNVDGSYSYGSGGAPAIVGAAYLNNRPGVTTTRFYVLDAARNQLAVVNPPNNGTLTIPVALSGLTLASGAPTGFDISGATGTAFVAFGGELFTLGLSTGQANLVGSFGTGVTDISSLSVPEPASWAMMIAGFGMAGAAMRRRLGLPAPKRLTA